MPCAQSAVNCLSAQPGVRRFSMNSRKNSPPYDPIREAETLVAIARELHRLADEATEIARAACERANTLPLLKGLDDE